MKANARLRIRVAELQGIIKQAQEDGVTAIEPDSTWESQYYFLSLELLQTRIRVTYMEYDYRTNKIVTDYALLSRPDDVNYMLSWIRRAIRKGYTYERREERREARIEARDNNE